VAVATTASGSGVVVWRWFDAVVLEETGSSVRLWEPAHGVVLAERRDSERGYRPGTRAYLSAGLPGAEWWVAGPVADRAEDADVDLDEVEQFFTRLGLWAGLT
jgi:Na+/alanine symporter